MVMMMVMMVMMMVMMMMIMMMMVMMNTIWCFNIYFNAKPSFDNTPTIL